MEFILYSIFGLVYWWFTSRRKRKQRREAQQLPQQTTKPTENTQTPANDRQASRRDTIPEMIPNRWESESTVNRNVVSQPVREIEVDHKKETEAIELDSRTTTKAKFSLKQAVVWSEILGQPKGLG